jgi:hypothetical protein
MAGEGKHHASNEHYKSERRIFSIEWRTHGNNPIILIYLMERQRRIK